MKVTGTRYIKAQPWFGKVEREVKQPKYQFAELEAIVRNWNKGAK